MSSFFFFSSELIVNRILIVSIVVNKIFSLLNNNNNNNNNDTFEPLHNGYLGDRGKWPLWRGGCYGEVGCNMTFFFVEYNMFFVPTSYIDNPVISSFHR